MRGVVVALVVLSVGCGPTDGGDGGSAAGTGGSSTSAATDADGTTAMPPDLPPEPTCPGGLGEAVWCSCAVVEGCSVSSGSSTGCNGKCVLPEPCAPVTCSYDGAYTDWGCEAELTEDTLACVFDALAAGQPMRWTMETNDSYINVAEMTRLEFRRLDATTYVTHSEHAYWNDVGESSESWGLSGHVIPESAWMECSALPEPPARFECLFFLAAAGEACPDPDLLVCPEGG